MDDQSDNFDASQLEVVNFEGWFFITNYALHKNNKTFFMFQKSHLLTLSYFNCKEVIIFQKY